jgi:integrase
MRKRLSPRTIKALKPGKDGLRHGAVIMDDLTPNLGVRILGTAKRPQHTFVLVTRFPGRTQPTRAALAAFDKRDDEAAAASLRAARRKAIDWLAQIEQGRDPRLEEARQREAQIRTQATVFGAVTEDFITEKLRAEVTDINDRTNTVIIDGKHWRYLERRGADVEREVRKEFKSWWSRPITDIMDEDVIRVIKAKAKTAPASARNILGHAKRLFQWAIDQRTYGIKVSPAADIKPAAIVGEKVARDRFLKGDEVPAFWRAAARMPYPAGPVYQLLVLTGLRLGEVSDANWSEFAPVIVRAIRQSNGKPIDWSKFDQRQLTWTIPSARMKGRTGKARAHVVPLTPDMLKILETLPVFVGGGSFLFSRNAGRTPAVMSTEIKADLDRRMLRTLRALARRHGDDPAAVRLKPWVNHDLRRTVRSGLSQLKIAEEIREAVLAHTRGGIKGVYDQHDYLDEKRDALVQWGTRLRGIVEPPPATPNVIALRG